ncbi:hypothetical protein [Geobacter sulfurreducens]|uniref:hypothetical protein n=1 Tax=Geobacter sulfurreducens TaxID=35554 RepID=UPI000DBB6FEC|nr:hypothetical protein [Geobacter sulfurreducens]BBA71730.1 hypothetical protein YM18_3222 [Geobacter sulfurreducens]
MTPPSASIPGGFYLASRAISEDLQDKPAHYLKLWDWMLRTAFFRDGKDLKRGELLTTIDEMRYVGGYSSGSARKPLTKDQVRSAYGHLTDTGRITTRKTTRGMVITVCNYDILQDPRSYAPHATAHATDLAETTRTPHDRVMNENKKKNKTLPAKTPPANSRLFSDWFCYAFEIVQGYPYTFEGGKDGKLLSEMLKAWPCKELVAKACHFLTDEDRFPKAKAPTISFLKSKINDYPNHINGEAEEFRALGLIPPEGVTLEDWKPWNE